MRVELGPGCVHNGASCDSVLGAAIVGSAIMDPRSEVSPEAPLRNPIYEAPTRLPRRCSFIAGDAEDAE